MSPLNKVFSIANVRPFPIGANITIKAISYRRKSERLGLVDYISQKILERFGILMAIYYQFCVKRFTNWPFIAFSVCFIQPFLEI